MVIHSKNDFILCRVFPSSLKGVTSNQFYSFLSHSIHNFENLTKLFLAQYSRQKFKQNNHHLLSIKMSPAESLKAYIDYFQNQLAKIRNYSGDASALTFISGLRVTHPLYKHLVKYITRWSGTLY